MTNQLTPRELFKRGFGTLEISVMLRRTEADVYNELSRRTEDEKLSQARPLIRYCGFDRRTKAWGGR